MERQPWNLERVGAELKFVLLQLAGILYGSFAKHFSPIMSLLCLSALLSMHAFSNEGIVRWNDLRVARGWTLIDLLMTKLGEVILLSVAISWQVRFSIDVTCLLLDRFLTQFIGISDKIVIEFFNNYCSIPPLRQFEFFCHIFCLYYLIIVLNVLNNMPLN
nr:uncharacterized protein LOC106680117 [Halyomorpha halys]XP_014275103.1 uncharacterized protein LOC106680117 [Halyomorpha halys]